MASCCRNGHSFSSLLAQALISLAADLLHRPRVLSLLCSWDASKSKHVNLNQNMSICRIRSRELFFIRPVKLILGFGFHPQLRIPGWSWGNSSNQNPAQPNIPDVISSSFDTYRQQTRAHWELHLDCKSFIVICYDCLFIVACQAWIACKPNSVLLSHEIFQLPHRLCVPTIACHPWPLRPKQLWWLQVHWKWEKEKSLNPDLKSI